MFLSAAFRIYRQNKLVTNSIQPFLMIHGRPDRAYNKLLSEGVNAVHFRSGRSDNVRAAFDTFHRRGCSSLISHCSPHYTWIPEKEGTSLSSWAAGLAFHWQLFRYPNNVPLARIH